MGGSVPKQYLTDARGVAILRHALERAIDAVAWDSIVVAAPNQWVEYTQALLAGLCDARLLVVPGSPDRMDSLRQALATVPDRPDAVCVMHDGVRPCTPPELFRSVITRVESREFDACWPASVSRDTVLRSAAGPEWAVIPASQLLIAATPIATRHHVLARAISGEAVVDGILIDRLIRTGVTWTHVENSWWNFKVTTPGDVDLARKILDAQVADYLVSREVER